MSLLQKLKNERKVEADFRDQEQSLIDQYVASRDRRDAIIADLDKAIAALQPAHPPTPASGEGERLAKAEALFMELTGATLNGPPGLSHAFSSFPHDLTEVTHVDLLLTDGSERRDTIAGLWVHSFHEGHVRAYRILKPDTPATPEKAEVEAANEFLRTYSGIVRSTGGGERFMAEPEIPEGFTKWEGGECPVDPDIIVEVIFMTGDRHTGPAGARNWSGMSAHAFENIDAYRVIRWTQEELDAIDKSATELSQSLQWNEPEPPTPKATDTADLNGGIAHQLEDTSADAVVLLGEADDVLKGIGPSLANAQPLSVLNADARMFSEGIIQDASQKKEEHKPGWLNLWPKKSEVVS